MLTHTPDSTALIFQVPDNVKLKVARIEQQARLTYPDSATSRFDFIREQLITELSIQTSLKEHALRAQGNWSEHD